MELSIQQQGNVSLVQLQGQRLDTFHAGALKKALLELMQSQHLHFILDFSAVKFLDSGGLGVLMDLHKRLRPPAGLVLCNIHERTIRDVLRLTRMDQVLKIAEDEKQALKLFA